MKKKKKKKKRRGRREEEENIGRCNNDVNYDIFKN